MRQKAIRKPEPITVERIPDMDPASDEWYRWCRTRGLDALNSGRRAWCTDAQTYIRGGEYLEWCGERVIGILHADEIDLVKE